MFQYRPEIPQIFAVVEHVPVRREVLAPSETAVVEHPYVVAQEAECRPYPQPLSHITGVGAGYQYGPSIFSCAGQIPDIDPVPVRGYHRVLDVLEAEVLRCVGVFFLRVDGAGSCEAEDQDEGRGQESGYRFHDDGLTVVELSAAFTALVIGIKVFGGHGHEDGEQQEYSGDDAAGAGLDAELQRPPGVETGAEAQDDGRDYDRGGVPGRGYGRDVVAAALRAEGDGVVHPVGDGGYYFQGFFVVLVGYVQCGAGVRTMCPGPSVGAFIVVPAHCDVVGLQYA